MVLPGYIYITGLVSVVIVLRIEMAECYAVYLNVGTTGTVL